jgi:hypothetical protein
MAHRFDAAGLEEILGKIGAGAEIGSCAEIREEKFGRVPVLARIASDASRSRWRPG